MSARADLTKGIFEEFLGQRFTWELDQSETFEMTLISVEGLRPGHAGAKPGAREPFSLVFCAPPEARLPQRIYRTQHPTLGPMDIFLVPIGPDPQGRGMRMEAIYNFTS